MGRPAKSLLARVLENSFRPDRYGALIAQEPLPRRAPFQGERRKDLWRELRAIQGRYNAEPEYRSQHAQDFSKIVRVLHGARPPRWYSERMERRRRVLDDLLAKMEVRLPDIDRFRG
jgi:hypothetical protein